MFDYEVVDDLPFFFFFLSNSLTLDQNLTLNLLKTDFGGVNYLYFASSLQNLPNSNGD